MRTNPYFQDFMNEYEHSLDHTLDEINYRVERVTPVK